MLYEKIRSRESGILTYGITPPKVNHPEEKLREISQRQCERMMSLPIDGVVLYDIQDEKDRTDAERPFPFIETVDPELYARDYLKSVTVPKIIYRCVGKYDSQSLIGRTAESKVSECRVFVGAASQDQKVKLRLSEAYRLYQQHHRDVLLGGVTIPERHSEKQDEHLRLFRKKEMGCQFFVSQAVYNIQASLDLISDYHLYCKEKQVNPVPIIFTLSPCGSNKTLDFMKWLGINIPRWLENELVNCDDILDKSVGVCMDIFRELYKFATQKGIPVGFNVESVAIRKAEIDAALTMIRSIAEELETARINGLQV